MNPRLKQLRDLGQSLWLDNITRDLLDSGTLAKYIRLVKPASEGCVTDE